VGLVVVLSVAAVGLLSRFGTRREIQRFLEVETVRQGDELPDLAGAAVRLEALHRRAESWEGVRPVLRDLREELPPGDDLVLLAPDGGLIAATDPDLAPGDVTVAADGTLQVRRRHEQGGLVREEEGRIRAPSADVRDGQGTRVASVYVLPDLDVNEGAAEDVLLDSVDRWLWLGALAAGLVALAATAVVAGRILGPVEQLTRAARRLAEGDLRQRVAVASRDEVGELARAFNRMADALERQEHLRRQMVTDVAHDLRTPLTNIQGQLEAIQDGLLQPTGEVLASLQEEVLFLAGLVRDLQDLSLADAGALRLEAVPLYVRAEVERVIEELRPAGAGGPRIDNGSPEGLLAFADPVRFRQIVRNLLANALAHAGPAGAVEVEARLAGTDVEISVRDDGPGIAPEHQPHVFERFYRADGSRDRTSGGAGLGLAIVKKLVQLQGGAVRVESRPGDGATFRFTIPSART
jgi:signal transduction histidine kinase